jgi:CRP-like cAMP-binding protein
VRQQNVVCNLPPPALDDFRAASSMALYKPRQVIFSEGGPVTGLYLVCQGAVKLYHSDRFGRDHILEVVGPGGLLGELPFDGDQALSVSGEALCDSQLCFLPREQLVAFVQRYPMTGVHLIAALSHELAMARRKVRDLALKGAESRLAGLLLQLARAEGPPSSGQRLRLRFKRREMAEMVGVSTETVIRLLGKLDKRHLIRIEGREVVIADAERLAQVAHYGETEG